MKMKIILNTIGGLCLSLILISCAPTPVYKVSSIDDIVDYSDGREYITKEDEQTATSIEFDDYTNENLVFYIQVLNKEEKPITFHPENIRVETLRQNLLSFDNPQYDYAIDPEEQIDMLNNEIKNRENWHEAATGLNIAFGILSIVADIADDDNRNDAFEIAEDIAVFTTNQANEEIEYDIDKNELNSEKGFWKNEVLRKTTLNKDEQIGGLVFLPFNPNAKFFKIEIPVGNKVHSYFYKQFRMK